LLKVKYEPKSLLVGERLGRELGIESLKFLWYNLRDPVMIYVVDM
jgi:hypothetical protein